MNFHKIDSTQEMVVEREYGFRHGSFQQLNSTVTVPVSEDGEQFECECGESFETKEEAEDHIKDEGGEE